MGGSLGKDPSRPPGRDDSATPHAHRAIRWRHRPLALGCLGDAAHAHRHRSLCLARRGARGVRARLSSPRGARRRRVDAWGPGPVEGRHPLLGHYLVTAPSPTTAVYTTTTPMRETGCWRRPDASARSSGLPRRDQDARRGPSELHGRPPLPDRCRGPGGRRRRRLEAVARHHRNQVRRGQKEGFEVRVGPTEISLSTASSTPTCASWARPLTRSATMN